MKKKKKYQSAIRMFSLITLSPTLILGGGAPVVLSYAAEGKVSDSPITEPSNYSSKIFQPTEFLIVENGQAEATIQLVEEPIIAAEEPQEDRTSPIYKVYYDGVQIEVPAEWQWYIRDMAAEYNFPEKVIFGLIIKESGFDPKAKGDKGRSIGLCQIQKYWIKTKNISHFTDDYSDRNLYDVYDNILTLMEIWNYARNKYDIDLSIDQGVKDLLYFHNTGKYKKNVKWGYSDKVLEYANGLIALQ
jgi:hypothetical protein